MKRFITLFFALIFICMLPACSGKISSEMSDSSALQTSDSMTDAQLTADEKASENNRRILVVYFSATGTTERIAGYAAAAMGADIYEIIPAQPYTASDLDYSDKSSRTTKEMNDPSSRPAIRGGVENMEDYEIIFIGYPIWWGDTPRIVSTFMESYDFSGKTIVTFSTSGSSSHNDSSIKSLVGDVNWISGIRMNERNSQAAVAEWINSLGLDIEAK